MIIVGMPYYDEYYDRAVGVFLLILTLIGDNDNIHKCYLKYIHIFVIGAGCLTIFGLVGTIVTVL